MPESEYEVELFRKQGFTRQTCAKCGKAFWSLGHHETCGEAPCQEYDFIGNSPFKKKLTYRAMREDFLSFLEQNGHARVKRYPIVARWRVEVFFGGAEAATLVFMQNRDVNGHRVPMDTTVVDTGYGLERLTWLSQGTTSAYEAVFGDALAYLKRATGAKRVDDKVLREYSKVAGMLKVEDLADIREIRRQTAERVGISVEDLVAQVSPLEALYTVCDHARALIFLLGDGVVPSSANSRTGPSRSRMTSMRGWRPATTDRPPRNPRRRSTSRGTYLRRSSACTRTSGSGPSAQRSSPSRAKRSSWTRRTSIRRAEARRPTTGPLPTTRSTTSRRSGLLYSTSCAAMPPRS